MDETRNMDFTGYQRMMAEVDAALSGMESICGELEMEDTVKALAESKRKLLGHNFSVGILGEFKRGKSTVINSLLEKEIMPADIQPCSATMNRVTYDMQPHVELHMRNGTTKHIQVEELSDYVTKLNRENESRAAEVDEAVVYYPCRFCKNGVDIVDTPGLNDDERMNRITEETIPKLDAVIMVIVPGSPFSMSESEFVRNKLMSSDLGRVIFLVNKIDSIRRIEDQKRAVEGIRDKIQETVLNKMSDLYGEDSDRYKDAQKKMGKIKIFPLSALDALEGKMSGDDAMIEKSGTLAFEAALTKMLTEERGALELGRPLAVLQKTSIEVSKVIQARRDAMSMSAEEFEQRQKDTIARMKELRNQKKTERKKLENRSKEVQRDLSSRTAQFYPTLEDRMIEVVDRFDENPRSFATVEGQKAGAEKLNQLVSAEMNNMVSGFSERITMELSDVVNAETLQASKFTANLSQQLDSLRAALTASSDVENRNDVIALGVDVLTDFAGIYGIGGVVAGYQAAGFKGAALGGAAGLMANLLAAGILGGMGLVGLPMFVITCAIGTIVGKKVPQAVFSAGIGKKKMEEVKQATKNNIQKAVREMRREQYLEKWIEELVVKRFEELADQMDDECETLLQDTERSMNAIRKDLVRSRTDRENVVKMLENAETRCINLIKGLEPICQRVNSALREA